MPDTASTLANMLAAIVIGLIAFVVIVARSITMMRIYGFEV